MAVLSPATLDEALDALAAHPEAHVLAGGTDFMVEVNFGHRRPDDVVALRRIDELRGWSVAGDTIRLGGGVTCTQLMDLDLARHAPALAQAARTVGSPQIRNAATIGGNLGTGSPAGDLLPVLAALDATILLRSATGSRRLSIHEFLVGPKRTALAPGELVVEVVVPIARGPQEFLKVGVRNAMVIAIASIALVVQDGAVAVAAGSVGPTVLRARDAEVWLSAHPDGQSEATAAEFGRRVAAEMRPIDDHRSTAVYRRRAVEVMAARALRRVAAA
jgi:CO/xanthine dehydrogenase FAD-binding subunit